MSSSSTAFFLDHDHDQELAAFIFFPYRGHEHQLDYKHDQKHAAFPHNAGRKVSVVGNESQVETTVCDPSAAACEKIQGLGFRVQGTLKKVQKSVSNVETTVCDHQMMIEFRIPRSEALSSQPASDPGTNDDDCTGIGCWLTVKRFGSQNSEFDLEDSSVMSAGKSCIFTYTGLLRYCCQR